jgi:phosphopantetheinyl transferase
MVQRASCPCGDDRPHPHRGGRGCGGTAPVHGVGVDVKPVAPLSNDVERFVFTRHERSVLDRVDPADRAEWSTRLWCAKEAVAKALVGGCRCRPHGWR